MFENITRSIIAIALSLLSIYIFSISLAHLYYNINDSFRTVRGNTCDHLSTIISLQNDTIEILESVIARNVSSIYEESILANTEERTALGDSSNSHFLTAKGAANQIESTCESQYGIDLIKGWQDAEELWCSSPTSSLKCYPFRQIHKRQSRIVDNFCVAENFVVDFSKVYVWLFYI